MPAKLPVITGDVTQKLKRLGAQIRARRKALHVSATAAAEAASMSRVTLHRIEHGEPSVTMGAYCNAMAALDLDFGVIMHPTTDTRTLQYQGWIPARIPLANYPQLKQLAWQVHGADELTPVEALGIYERNRRHLNFAVMEPAEQALIDALRLALGESRSHV